MDTLFRRVTFTVNVGVFGNKLLAKMASDFKKPDMVHTLYPEEIQKKMWPLPVSDLFFVGRATTKKLFDVGIRTIGELAAADPVWLRSILKKQGEVIWGFANGVDISPVLEQLPANKGYGNSTTTPYDVTDVETADRVLLALAETLGNRLRADNVKIAVVAVGIRYADLSYVSHQMVLGTATNLTWEIYQAACRLFLELWNHRPIRHLGIHTSRVKDDDFFRQTTLFDEVDYEKLEKVDKTVDALRKRYGMDSVMRAAFLRQSVNHMSGGYLKRSKDALGEADGRL